MKHHVVCFSRFNWNLAVWLPMHFSCRNLPKSDVVRWSYANVQ